MEDTSINFQEHQPSPKRQKKDSDFHISSENLSSPLLLSSAGDVAPASSGGGRFVNSCVALPTSIRLYHITYDMHYIMLHNLLISIIYMLLCIILRRSSCCRAQEAVEASENFFSPSEAVCIAT